MPRHLLSALLLSALPFAALANGFDVTALGARGGIQDGNLSAWMIAPAGDSRAVTCDAGSLVAGLIAAEEKGALDGIALPEGSEYSRPGHVLVNQIKGYLISHAHLDHISGLVVASPDDGKKPIYALASVAQKIGEGYFNWSVWPNFATTGTAPALGKYQLRTLKPGQPVPVEGTAMQVSAFPLAHSGAELTAFLIESGEDAILCFGDTGPDAVEGGTKIADIWAAVADKLREGRLRAMIIEVSYVNAQPDNLLFGHLTPKWLISSLHQLEDLAGEGSLKDLPLIVSHVKYSLKSGETPQQAIGRELDQANDLGLRIIMPEQGDHWRFGEK